MPMLSWLANNTNVAGPLADLLYLANGFCLGADELEVAPRCVDAPRPAIALDSVAVTLF